MNILLIHQAFVGPNEAGGTRHFELARHCAEKGHQFNIIRGSLSYLTGRSTVEENSYKYGRGNVIVRCAYTYPSLHKSFVWRVLSFMSFMIASVWTGLRCPCPDLVMGTSPPIFQAVSAWFISIMRRRPFLLEIRDLWPEFAIDLGVLRNPILIWLTRKLELFLYERAAYIIVNSPAYKIYLVNKGVHERKVTLVANGVDGAMFDPEELGEDIRRQFGLNGKFVVVYTGALGLANDIGNILKAAQHVRNDTSIHFLLVGDGKERNELELLASALGLVNVTFTGAKPKSQIPDFLAASNVCVATLQNIPMFTTTYPNKVFDYMAAGRPTILAIDGVIRQVIEEARGGIFVSPGDDTDLAKAILYLKGNPDIASEMGRAARDYVVREFSRKKQAEQFEGVLVRFAE